MSEWDPRIQSDLLRSATNASARNLAAALEGLDRATRNFNRRLGELPEPAPETVPGAPHNEMLEAQREARRYLEGAKHRIDSMIGSAVAAVERETAEMRQEAEAQIQARWHQIEIEAQHHVAEARAVAERMVADRHARISATSDEILARADALTASMEDAEQVRAQFDAFVRSLATTADQIAAIAPRQEITAVDPPPDDGGISRPRAA